jgi:hypothetical protein
MGLEEWDSYSVIWEPGEGTIFRVSSSDSCGSIGNSFDENERGCHPYTQNVNPPGSWEVFRV